MIWFESEIETLPLISKSIKVRVVVVTNNYLLRVNLNQTGLAEGF